MLYMYNQLIAAINNTHKNYSKIIFVCIGTDRSTGDSYGPLVGSMLKKNIKNNDIKIYGTLEEPIHAKNLISMVEKIKEDNNLIIAIDASLGNEKQVNKVFIDNSPIKPGLGVDKKLPKIGDISIQGVVNLNGNMNFLILQNTRLNTVMELAKKTYKTICCVLEEIIYKS